MLIFQKRAFSNTTKSNGIEKTINLQRYCLVYDHNNRKREDEITNKVSEKERDGDNNMKYTEKENYL